MNSFIVGMMITFSINALSYAYDDDKTIAIIFGMLTISCAILVKTS